MMNRRNMLKTVAAVTGAAIMMRSTSRATASESEIYSGGTPWGNLLGWRVGCQAYSFNRFTFEEAVKKNASMGLQVIEGFPGQKISKEMDAAMGPGLNQEQRFYVKSILADHNMTMPNFGVTDVNPAVFEFAIDMGIETLNTEPPFDQLPKLDKMAQKYGVNLGLHNHPKPSIYWDYQIVLDNIKDLSPRVGACVDTGHYVRSGINPVEAIRALKGRIVSFHLKDLNEKSPNGHDVPWGTGVSDIPAILAELEAQRFRGVFSAEYEHNWDNSVPEIAESVRFFNDQSRELSK